MNSNRKMISKNIDLDKAKKLSVHLGNAILSLAILSGCTNPDKSKYILNKNISNKITNEFENISNNVPHIQYNLFEELPS